MGSTVGGALRAECDEAECDEDGIATAAPDEDDEEMEDARMDALFCLTDGIQEGLKRSSEEDRVSYRNAYRFLQDNPRPECICGRGCPCGICTEPDTFMEAVMQLVEFALDRTPM